MVLSLCVSLAFAALPVDPDGSASSVGRSASTSSPCDLYCLEQVHSTAMLKAAWDHGESPQATVQRLELERCSRTYLTGRLARRIEIRPGLECSFLAADGGQLSLPENALLRRLVTSHWSPPEVAAPERCFGLADVSDDGRRAVAFSYEVRLNSEQTEWDVRTNYRLFEIPGAQLLTSWETRTSGAMQVFSGLLRGPGPMCLVIEEEGPGQGRLLAVGQDGKSRPYSDRRVVAVRAAPSREEVGFVVAEKPGSFVVCMQGVEAPSSRWERRVECEPSPGYFSTRLVWEAGGDTVLLVMNDVEKQQLLVWGLSVANGGIRWQRRCAAFERALPDLVAVSRGTKPDLLRALGVELNSMRTAVGGK